MQRSMLRVRGSFWQFVREHISEPFWGIYNELVHNQPLTLTDANALADSSYRYCTLLYSTALYSTLLYSTALYLTVLLSNLHLTRCCARCRRLVGNLFFLNTQGYERLVKTLSRHLFADTCTYLPMFAAVYSSGFHG